MLPLKFITIHANFVARKNRGVLIFGAPGVGKSHLSHVLVQKHGYHLIADDLVLLRHQKKGILGELPNADYLGLLHLKEKGFVKVTQASSRHAITDVIEIGNQIGNMDQIKLLNQNFLVPTFIWQVALQYCLKI
ncbi:phosphoenolpyruvate carboxykinase (ATP) [Facilibium subflavum]|uniref:hypothetical protein n=1 Tax=Facilibium subflavum TaxID=2219058 RepID=UPI0013C349D1|nr:hypothetical protein [Facilibium subflavum]